jgi:hypothetical protein
VNVKYSTNGEHVVVFNNYGSEIFLFRRDGSLRFAGNYTDLIRDKSKILYNVLLSGNSNELLINAGNDANLVSLKDGIIKFKAPVGRIIDADFRYDKGIIILKTASEKNELVDLKILSASNGLILDKIDLAERIELALNGVIVFKDSSIVEYEFK